MTTRRYILATAAASAFVVLLTFAHVGSAQVGGAPFCSTNTPTVGVNQSALFTATGGNGSYVWSGDNISTNNPTGSQFTVSYPNPGTYIIRVMSNGGTATCPLNVVSNYSNNTYTYSSNTINTLACLPTYQNVTLGQTAFVSATGGNGSYTWNAPDLLTNNPFGSGFSASYASAGTHVITVSSGGYSANCTVNVLGPSIVYPTPGLPNTGGGYGHW